MIDSIYKTVKPSHLKKLQIIKKTKKPNVSSRLHILWLNFGKANDSFLHPFLFVGNRFSKKSAWNLEWETKAWVKIHRFNVFSRNVNTINLIFLHTWWNIQVSENSASILERDKTLKSLKKSERKYPWG